MSQVTQLIDQLTRDQHWQHNFLPGQRRALIDVMSALLIDAGKGETDLESFYEMIIGSLRNLDMALGQKSPMRKGEK